MSAGPPRSLDATQACDDEAADRLGAQSGRCVVIELREGFAS
jgi:hypothetical protein